ncbi:MAG: MATE family efflux transporter [Chloroflexota bacterium]
MRVPTDELKRSRVLALAWPIVLAQAATATTGVVDTAAMGRFGTAVDLAAVSIAAVSFSFIYWSFGFLRMSTTGLTAQAQGARDLTETRAVLARSGLIGLALGLALLILFPIIREVGLGAFQAEAVVKEHASGYFDARIWGAPAALIGFAINGWLIGTGRTRALLLVQVVLNATNAALDLWFVAGLRLGPTGIGAGTAIAEWVALLVGLWIVRADLRLPPRLIDRERLVALFAANRDIMIRTLALLFSFAWFVNSGARVGTAQLAGNEVLLQFISVAAFVLDGFAFVAEKEVGEAFGARDPARLRRAVRLTSEFAFGFGAVLSVLYLVGGRLIIGAVVADPAARAAALEFLPFCAAVPVLGVAAWQLDGIFLGTTRGRALRTAGVAAAVLYIAADLVLAPRFGNSGVWTAFLLMYVFRALGLAAFWPSLLRETRRPPVV